MEGSRDPVLVLDEVRPGFRKRHEEFVQFVQATLEDLQGKHLTLAAQSSMLRSRQKLRHYLSCQLYMLQKHIRRLHKFETEVSGRVLDLAGGWQPEAEKEEPEEPNSRPCSSRSMGARSNSSTTSSSSSLSISSSNVVAAAQDPASALVLLEGDMVKMKRRCKHMLDVTDKYCVLNSRTDLEIEGFEETLGKPASGWIGGKLPDEGSDAVDGRRGDESLTSSEDGSIPPLPTFKARGAVHMTLESLANHVLVIVKSYTKKNSSS